MATVPVQTQVISREDLTKLVPKDNFRLVKFFENISKDVSVTLPEAIEALVQGPQGGAVDDNVVVFDGTSGSLVKDSGVAIDSLAPLESPAFTGAPTAPTPAPGDSSGRIATTEFVDDATLNAVDGPASSTDDAIALFNGTTGKLLQDSTVLLSSLAPLASPTFTGIPEAPTAALGTDTDQVASTAFVQDAIDNLATAAANFSVHNNGVAQSIPNNAFTQLTFSTEVFDNGSAFASNAWTPPAGRPVLLTGAVTLPTVSAALTTIEVYKNGAVYKRGVMTLGSGSNAQTLTVQCIDIPNGTDVYTLRAFQNTGAAVNTVGNAELTYFQGTTLRA